MRWAPSFNRRPAAAGAELSQQRRKSLLRHLRDLELSKQCLGKQACLMQ
jgi:hypothetical protein